MTAQRFDRRTFLASTAALSLGMTPVAQATPRRRRESTKKGLGVVAREDGKWLKHIQALQAHWFYGWGSNKPDNVPESVEFAPMIWGNSKEEKLTAKLERLREQFEAGEISHLMGFNEPDQHSQSNMTVERVLELWPLLMEPGIPLVSPGCVHPDREWMKDFMGEVEKRDLRVDYISVHSYGGPSASALMKRLEKVYRMFGRPIWITEFAVGDWTAKSVAENKHSPAAVARFMREVIPALEAAKFVDRYAWFSGSPSSGPLGTSALFDSEGELTPLGELYRSA